MQTMTIFHFRRTSRFLKKKTESKHVVKTGDNVRHASQNTLSVQGNSNPASPQLPHPRDNAGLREGRSEWNSRQSSDEKTGNATSSRSMVPRMIHV